MARNGPKETFTEPELRNSLRKLDAFLVDNEELTRLNARLSRFNLFGILRIERAEIRHSNVLAWLLTPGESHGLGDAFLRRFLSKLLIENEDVETQLTPAKVELMRIKDIEVLREWHNIDVLVHSPREHWGLIIENKVGAKEARSQLPKYMKEAEAAFPEIAFIPVFLTLEGEEPSEEGRESGYVPISHGQVLEIAEQVVGQNQSRIPADAAVLIDHYLATLRRLTMRDSELVDLCKAIYRKHKDAIDLIVQYGSASQVLDGCEAKVKELIGAGQLMRTVNRVWFLPKEMAVFQTEMGAGWGFLPTTYPIMWWFYYHKRTGKLQLVMEVGPVGDYGLRKAILNGLKEAGLKFWEEGAFRKEAKFTRVISHFHKLDRKKDEDEPDDTPEYVMKLAGELWAKCWPEGKKAVEVLKRCKPAKS